MAKTKINGYAGRKKITLGSALIYIAAFTNSPRYAGAFIYSDVQFVPPIVAKFLDYANITAGLALGVLEVVTMALLMDSLRRTPFIVTEKRKGKSDRKVLNLRWLIVAFWGVGLMGLAPLILVPYMDARGTGQTMHQLMLAILQDYYIFGLSAWNLFVVLAPIFVIGGASFAQVSVTHQESYETSESSGKVSPLFPNDWRKLTNDQKKELGKMDAKKISQNTGLTLRGAQNWEKDLKREGFGK